MSSFILTHENYHGAEANRHYFSSSQIKSFLTAPARTVAEQNGEYVSPNQPPLLVGSYVDVYFNNGLIY